MILDNDLDVLVLTESWLTGNQGDDLVIGDIKSTLPNYDLLHCPRIGSKGGGICIVYRSSAQVTLNSRIEFTSFELMDVTIRFSAVSVFRCYAVYRPPPSASNKFTYNMFLQEFLTLLESAVISDNMPLVLGDFNIHIDDGLDTQAKSFMNSIDSLGFSQHVNGPTHRAGHTLDLIMSRRIDDIISSVRILSGLSSDHSAIIADVNLTAPKNTKKLVQYRQFRNVDIAFFKQDILNSSQATSTPEHSSEAVGGYNDNLIQLIDRHAPLKRKNITVRPSAPWYTEELREAKRIRRQAERQMLSSGLSFDKQQYQEKCLSYYTALYEAKSKHLTAKIAEADTKELFRIVKRLTSPSSQETILPEHRTAVALANTFGDYFNDKIASTVSGVQTSAANPQFMSGANRVPDLGPDKCLSEFTPVPLNQVKKLIDSLKPKSCSLDPVPSWLVKTCVDELLPIITSTINLSLMSGEVPEAFKTCLITPLLKIEAIARQE
ncbi:uncharacterized protein LOC105444571 [Strongylocentrotus purpuratus]|uniref:Endonuclease/exonuclease/phosphatase domain-containing protein n=1 Tax=Strongylocentrotus purpuratus TaxID=7668 RepID=A0A7M7LWC9_STRPU|nr:uncharacterized protein LOC105444571 [Strongylocentrotus purpuratus]